MRLKFWQWFHDAAERLWHWSYYHGLFPELERLGRIDRRVSSESAYRYTVKFVNSKGQEVKE